MSVSNRKQVERRIKRLEFFSQKIWPFFRRFASDVIAPRCETCIISKNAPGVTLTNGICNFCEEYDEFIDPEEEAWIARFRENQRQELHETLTEYQGKGKGRYDAFVVYSGGRDSTYLVYKLRTEYPRLRLFAATWDNGFYSQIAMDTAREVAKKLDFDHIVYKPRSSLFKTLFRRTLQQAGERASYNTVDLFDGSLIHMLGMRWATELEIPLVLTGTDWAQCEIIAGTNHFETHHNETKGDTMISRVELHSGLKVEEMFEKDDADMFWNGYNWPVERIPRLLAPMAAWRPDKQEADKELIEVGLVAPGNSSSLHTNNEVLPLMVAIDFKKFGYCSYEPEFSAMIRKVKQIDHRYWRNIFETLEYLVQKNVFMDKAFMGILDRLDFTLADIGLE